MDVGIPLSSEIVAALTLQKAIDFDAGKLHLLGMDVPLTRDTKAADLAGAEFTGGGYAAKTVATWALPYRDSSGNVILHAPSQTWIHDGSTDSGVVFGWYYMNPDVSPKYVCGGKFAQPRTFSAVESGLDVEPAIVVPSAG